MSRAAVISSRSAKCLARAWHDRSIPRSPPSLGAHQHFSSAPQIPDEELDTSPLTAIFEDIERQTMEAEHLRALNHPTPWFNLLRYPARASWRSSDHLFDTKENGTSPLSRTQFNLIQRSGRTNKQLKRTYKRITEVHSSLATKRERERRMAANFTNIKHHNHPLTDKGGKLQDGKGRSVGSWNERDDTTTITCDDPSVSLLLSYGTHEKFNLENVESGSKSEQPNEAQTQEVNAMYRSKRRSKVISSAVSAPGSSSSVDKSVGYGPEQTMTNLRYRFGPNYSIVRRVLMEVQSLMGGTPSSAEQRCFRPKRVLDFGCGVGSSSAAALDVFGVPRTSRSENTGIEWIHSIDASQSMRDATECVLKSVLEGVPWGYDENEKDEEVEVDEYDKILMEIKGGEHEHALERKRQRMAKWEQSWERQNDYCTRLTFGESIVDSSSFYSQQAQDREEQMDRPSLPWQKQLDEQRRKAQQEKKATPSSQKGSFDLILCTYTLSELNSVSSTLAAAALLWEKLAAGGIMVFVEPGTPDGFSTLRSVRSMLLECSPPKEIRHLRYMDEKRILMEKLDAEDDETMQEALRSSLEELETTRHDWEEECQVLAPCTHNGLCPMSRHRKNHVKTNTRFGKYDTASESEDSVESAGATSTHEEDLNGQDIDAKVANDEGIDIDDIVSTSTNPELSEEEEEEQLMKELIEQGYSREELEEVMQLMEGLQDENDASDESDNEYDSDEGDHRGEDFYEMDPNSVDEPSRSKSTMAQTDAFGSAFCSFVHNFPGGTTRKKGEKFSYLVVQKRTPNDSLDKTFGSDKLAEVDVVNMLAKSSFHVQGLKQELIRMSKRKSSKPGDEEYQKLNESSLHAKELRKLLEEAVELEDTFLDSTRDKLSMELVHGKRRNGWGRLVRAPIKKKGHILVDYCSGGCSGCSQTDGTQGRIIRQKVSRGWSARVAPGCYAAARKSRWGGLWPDLSQRVL